MIVERSRLLAISLLLLAACGGSSHNDLFVASDAGDTGGYPLWTGLGGGAGAGGGSAGASGSDGAVAVDTGTTSGALGSACTATSECAAGLACDLPSGNMIPGGGPANGMCTLSCNLQTECAPFGGKCVGLTSSQGFCLQTCSLGSAPATKCQGRTDQACKGIYDNNDTLLYGACIPMCASDADCGSRRCDPALGMCVDGAPSLPPVGTPCVANDACDAQGMCALGACTAWCRFGSFDSCGYRRTPVDAAAGTVGACFAPLDDPNGNAGDVGFCWQLCDSPADCLVSGWGCDMSYKGDWGHGLCRPPRPTDAGTD
jgi:hypothetical protein